MILNNWVFWIGAAFGLVSGIAVVFLVLWWRLR